MSVALLKFSLIFIFFPKSAQFPFFDRLLDAMSAPSPIPALPHSSTMVIAGVYLGLRIDFSVIILLDLIEVYDSRLKE